MEKPVLMKNPSSVASGWNAACTDWEMYHDSLLAPLKEVWLKYKEVHLLDETWLDCLVQTSSPTARKAIVEMWTSIKQLAERLNW